MDEGSGLGVVRHAWRQPGPAAVAIVVCGEVTGRNSAGVLAPMAPFIGMLTASPSSPEFVVVDIAADGKPRAELEALCRQSGAV